MAHRKIEARVGGVLWETVLSCLREELERVMTASLQQQKALTTFIDF
jgi:hypothetical protein